MNDSTVPPAPRVAAAEALLNRGWGKPNQPLTGEDGGPIIQRIERVLIDPADSNS